MSVGAVNKQTGDRIPTAGMPAIDSVLSGSSTNPVQNRVVKAALDEKADTDLVASDFDAAASYTSGNYCIYEGKFYKFKNSHSGAWSASDVDEIQIAGELATLKSGLNNVSRNNLGSGVDVTSYDTESNMYTFPDDGYLVGFIGSDEIKVKILGATTSKNIDVLLNTGVAVNIRRGMRMYIMSNTANKLVAFTPFV